MLEAGREKPEPRTGDAPPASGGGDAEHEPVEKVDLSFEKPGTTVIALLGMAAVVTVGALFLLGFVPQNRREGELEAEAARARTELVTVDAVHPRPAPRTSELALPGTVRAAQETTICARVQGYLRRWVVDMGDEVKSGQLLAEIEVPELDQQLDQARSALGQLKARLATAEANERLAESTYKRYKTAAPGSVTEQDLAEREAARDVALCTVEAAKADIASGEANLRRLLELKSFAQVTAPFAGAITERDVDVGSLIMADNGKNQALFKIVQMSPARVFVAVPQGFAASIKDGQAASVIMNDLRGGRLEGTVERTSRAVDDATRTLLVQVNVPNEQRQLLPGMYVKVKLQVARDRPAMLIPESALVTTAEGTQVALVQGGDRIHFQRVEVDGDLGREVAVRSGLDEQDRVVSNPGEKVVEGLQVNVNEAKPVTPPAPKGG